MWIRSQNKKELYKVSNFSITKNFGGKFKFVLIGTISILSAKTIGLYTTEAEAKQELDRMEEHLNNNRTTVYQIN